MIFTPELKLLSLLHIPLFCVAPRVESQRCLKSLETQDQPPGEGGVIFRAECEATRLHATNTGWGSSERLPAAWPLGWKLARWWGRLKPSNMAVHPVFMCVCRHNSGRTSDQDVENMQSTDPTVEMSPTGAEPSDHVYPQLVCSLTFVQAPKPPQCKPFKYFSLFVLFPSSWMRLHTFARRRKKKAMDEEMNLSSHTNLRPSYFNVKHHAGHMQKKKQKQKTCNQ